MYDDCMARADASNCGAAATQRERPQSQGKTTLFSTAVVFKVGAAAHRGAAGGAVGGEIGGRITKNENK